MIHRNQKIGRISKKKMDLAVRQQIIRSLKRKRVVDTGFFKFSVNCDLKSAKGGKNNQNNYKNK